jgi:hypothetical protein
MSLSSSNAGELTKNDKKVLYPYGRQSTQVSAGNPWTSARHLTSSLFSLEEAMVLSYVDQKFGRTGCSLREP